MSIETNLHGRLRNTSLSFSHGLLPLMEAVVNSIHSIEEAGLPVGDGKIVVDIIRHQQGHLEMSNGNSKRGPDPSEDILGFKITDNGVGFNDANMKSFETLDSEHKITKGCRGVGRLLWLKAFRNVAIVSVYEEGSARKKRTFDFTAKAGVSSPVVTDVSDETPRETCVHLDGFGQKYREASRKTTRTIANDLFEHCLWYFVRDGGSPRIIVKDGQETVLLDDIYDQHMLSSASAENISVKGIDFALTHVRLRTPAAKPHIIAYCADNRLVKEEQISSRKVPGLYGKIHDENGDFVYACYVSSAYLNENVRSERTGFDIADGADDLLSDVEVSFKDITEKIVERIRVHLSGYLAENQKASRERVESFVAKEAPRYRPILSRIPEDQLNVDPKISDKDLELELHKHLSTIERTLIEEGHDIMTPKIDETKTQYQQRLQKYLQKAEDIKKSDLANYVSHRKVIIDLMEMAIRKDNNGCYAREDLIHELIMPMRTESGDLMPDGYNLWLINERLAFHDYLASDKTLSSMVITGSTETKEPDLCALNVFDNPLLVAEGNKLPMASIVVVEIKRPMRNDAKEGEDKDPIEQALGYLDRIRQGKVQTASGRPIPRSESIPGFCYILCDLTPTMEGRCKMHDAIRTSDGLGYFFYKKNYEAYVEVISFDGLINAAKERNRAFFDKLGLPCN